MLLRCSAVLLLHCGMMKLWYDVSVEHHGVLTVHLLYLFVLGATQATLPHYVSACFTAWVCLYAAGHSISCAG
jgi:hypothetical protein